MTLRELIDGAGGKAAGVAKATVAVFVGLIVFGAVIALVEAFR